MQQLEGDLRQAADRHGVELLAAYETVARLEAALGEQGLELEGKRKALAAAEKRAARADAALAAAQSGMLPLQGLKREVETLVAAWNASSRSPALPAANPAAAVSIMRDILGKEQTAGSSKISPRGGGSSPRQLKGYIAEVEAAGGSLMSPAASAAGAFCLSLVCK